jgi:hypothetical protein
MTRVRQPRSSRRYLVVLALAAVLVPVVAATATLNEPAADRPATNAPATHAPPAHASASNAPAPSPPTVNRAPAPNPGTSTWPPPFLSLVTRVDPATAAVMTGVSWKPGCPVGLADLRVVYLTHWGFDARIHFGRLVVHRDVSASVVRALRAAYDARFPFRRIELVDTYGGSDDASMAADNTSAFNCRPVTGNPGRWSMHSYGRAIDINPVENPYVRGTVVLPPAGRPYVDRTVVRPGMIRAGDAVHRAFLAERFDWGGSWVTLKDYQHFERPGG